MKKQLNCSHYIKESTKASTYSYNIKDFELNLCKSCERKLRREILEQIKSEARLR